MNQALRNRLLKVASGGAIAIAWVLIDAHEGVRYTPYRDTGGIWTVCRGITGSDVVKDKRYTESECGALERKHLAIAAAGVTRVIKVPLNDWQRAALVDFAFNLGEPALASSTMARMFNARDYVGGCTQLHRWVKGRVKGELVTLGGLVKRRADEADICLNWGRT